MGVPDLRITRLLLPLLLAACADKETIVHAREPRVIRAASGRAETAPAADAPQAMAGRRMGVDAPAMSTQRAAWLSAAPQERETAVLEFEGDLAELAPLATSDRIPEVRLAAVQRLAEGDTPVVRAALRRALEDADADVVAEAILAVAALDDRKAIPALKRLRAHPDAEIRGLADDTLDALRP